MDKVPEAILKTLCYRDIFDYPLTASEIHTFLPDVRANELTVKRTLEQLVDEGWVEEQDGFYYLAGRADLPRRRVGRTGVSGQKYEQAFELSQLLKKVPFVKAAFITGTLAAGNADEKDDLDFLIITASNRVWLVRLMSYVLFTIKGVKRSRGVESAPGKVCLNMFLSEDALELPQEERNLFTAHEICLARPLWAKDHLHLKFLGENSWINGYLPNFKVPETDNRKPETGNHLWDRLVDRLDLFVYKLQLWYMRSRRTREVVERNRIMFHPVDLSKKIISAHKVRFYTVLHTPSNNEETLNS